MKLLHRLNLRGESGTRRPTVVEGILPHVTDLNQLKS